MNRIFRFLGFKVSDKGIIETTTLFSKLICEIGVITKQLTFVNQNVYIKWTDYLVYCPECSSCGIDGCCPATMCNFGKGCIYPKGSLEELQEGYNNFNLLYNWIANEDNKYFGKKEEVNNLIWNNDEN